MFVHVLSGPRGLSAGEVAQLAGLAEAQLDLSTDLRDANQADIDQQRRTIAASDAHCKEELCRVVTGHYLDFISASQVRFAH